MRANGTASLALTAAAAGICAALAGCASGAGAQAPAAGTHPSAQRAGSRQPGHVTRPSQTSAAGPADRNGTPSATTPASASLPPASGRKASAMLTRGLYTDAPDGSPHYVLSFAPGAGSAIRGSVSFLYQDGRISTVGSYAGTLSGTGKITLTLGDGKALSGRYAAGRLNLAGCATALPLAKVAGCTFTYHGHVP